MLKSEKAFQLAREIVAIESQIAELQAKHLRLADQFKTLVPDDSVTRSVPPPETPSGRGELPARVLRFLQENQGSGFAAGLIARRVGGEPKAVQNILLRLAKPEDGRVTKIKHGIYTFRAAAKGAAEHQETTGKKL